MITKRIRIQLAVFSTLTAIAVGLIAFHYVGVPALLGIGQVQAAAVFPEGAGIYPQANVTFRGVTVGKVTGVGLDPKGVRVSFRVASSAHVPADVTASIKSVSAIGEQYVDLVPLHDGGPRLADGDVIPLADTRVPVQTAVVLDDVDNLLRSVPLNNLDTVLNEADLAFKNLGPQLNQLTNNAMELVDTANANYSPTHVLLADGSKFLDGQQASSASMRNWSSDLARFSTTLRSGDRNLASMLQSLPGAADQANQTVDLLAKDLPPLMTPGKVLADLAADYRQSIEDVLSAYPITAMHNIAYSTVSPNLLRLGFKTVANYPGSCSQGWPRDYQPLGPRGPFDLSDEAAAQAYCKIPQSDPRVVRGARNLPCFEPGSPPGRRAATIQQCRGAGYGNTGGSPAPLPIGVVPGANLTGQLGAYLTGASANSTTTRMTGEQTWQTLLLAPLGK